MPTLTSKYCSAVQRLYSIYPLSSAGAALVLVRLFLAAHLIYGAWIAAFRSEWIEIAFVAGALGLAIGFITPLWALACLVLAVAALFGFAGPLPFWLSFDALPAMAVMLIGPGGFSIDARLFGHEVIEWKG